MLKYISATTTGHQKHSFAPISDAICNILISLAENCVTYVTFDISSGHLSYLLFYLFITFGLKKGKTQY